MSAGRNTLVPPDRSTVQPWLEVETERLLATVEALREADLTKDSSLPGWTVGHLLTHIARNADALCNLLQWARTGIESPMYASRQQRNDDINLGVTRPGDVVITDVIDSAARWWSAADGLAPADWNHDVITAQGRTIPAAQVPWLRLREVTIHHVDLGATFEDAAPGLVTALLDDVVNSVRTKPGWPALRIETTDGDSIDIGSPTVNVKGAQAHVLAWLTGRSPGHELITSSETLPDLPAWL